MNLKNNKFFLLLRSTYLVVIYRKITRAVITFNAQGKGIIQIANTTYFDRHPRLFEFVKNQVNSKNNLTILSFGSSTGLECLSIVHYIPSSKVIGIDINKANIIKAKRFNSHPNIEYIYMDIIKDNYLRKKKFDIIFALSVLCLEPEARHLDNISRDFSFKYFDAIISKLDELLNVGGYLVIKNSNYIFEDTVYFQRYQPIYGEPNTFPTFNYNGSKIEMNFRNIVFKKIEKS